MTTDLVYEYLLVNGFPYLAETSILDTWFHVAALEGASFLPPGNPLQSAMQMCPSCDW